MNPPTMMSLFASLTSLQEADKSRLLPGVHRLSDELLRDLLAQATFARGALLFLKIGCRRYRRNVSWRWASGRY
jgi:hypothetical protein